MSLELYKNSFVTLEEANDYFEDRFESESWSLLEDTDKEKLLITASQKINAFDYVGVKENASQLLEFPRNYGTPHDVKDAVCEEAIAIAQKSKDVHKLNQDANITSISLGVGSVSYGGVSKSEEANLLVSITALYLVKRWVKKGFYIPC